MRNDLGGRKKVSINSCNYKPLGFVKKLDDVTLKLNLINNNGLKFDVTGQTLSLRCKKANKQTEELSNTNTDTPITINGSEIDIKLRNSMLSIPGTVNFELNISDNTGALTTASFFIIVSSTELDDNSIISSNQYSILQQLINDYNSLIDTDTTAEVVNARGTYSTLGDRFNGIYSLVLKKPYYFNTVSDMKNSLLLTVGSCAITLGYYSAGDGGGAEYQITSTKETGEKEILYVPLANNNYAKIISKEQLNVLEFGIKNDKTQDIAPTLQKMINYAKSNAKSIYFPAGDYLQNNTVDFGGEVSNTTNIRIFGAGGFRNGATNIYQTCGVGYTGTSCLLLNGMSYTGYSDTVEICFDVDLRNSCVFGNNFSKFKTVFNKGMFWVSEVMYNSFYGCHYKVINGGSQDSYIHHNYFSGFGRDDDSDNIAICATYFNLMNVHDNWFEFYKQPIKCDGENNSHVYNNFFDYCLTCIDCGGVIDGSIHDNKFNHCTTGQCTSKFTTLNYPFIGVNIHGNDTLSCDIYGNNGVIETTVKLDVTQCWKTDIKIRTWKNREVEVISDSSKNYTSMEIDEMYKEYDVLPTTNLVNGVTKVSFKGVDYKYLNNTWYNAINNNELGYEHKALVGKWNITNGNATLSNNGRTMKVTNFNTADKWHDFTFCEVTVDNFDEIKLNCGAIETNSTVDNNNSIEIREYDEANSKIHTTWWAANKLDKIKLQDTTVKVIIVFRVHHTGGDTSTYWTINDLMLYEKNYNKNIFISDMQNNYMEYVENEVVKLEPYYL
nr:MAG TPA: tail fiber protein [Caudoviricetes sp.]